LTKKKKHINKKKEAKKHQKFDRRGVEKSRSKVLCAAHRPKKRAKQHCNCGQGRVVMGRDGGKPLTQKWGGENVG